MLAAVAAVTFVSCDNNANKTTEGADSTAVAAYNVDQLDSLLANTTDTTAIQAMLNDANTEVQRLTEAGDTEGAKSLLAKIKNEPTRYPRLTVATANGALKLSISSFKDCLTKTRYFEAQI